MRGTVLYGPRDIRFEDRDDPKIEKPTDAVIRMAATCVCVPALAKSTFPRSCVGPHLAPQLCSGNICKAYQNTASAQPNYEPCWTGGVWLASGRLEFRT